MGLCRRARGQNGFSLIELLLVSALVPVIAFVIYSNFASGMRLWQASQKQGSAEDVQIFFQRASADFEQAFKYASIPFEGSSGEVMFACPVQADAALGGDRGIGQARFFYDGGHKQIVRSVKNLSQISEDRPGTEKVLLRGVESLEISYFVHSLVDKNYRWGYELDPKAKELPVAVRFQMVVDDGGQKKPFTKTFTIPVGSG